MPLLRGNSSTSLATVAVFTLISNNSSSTLIDTVGEIIILADPVSAVPNDSFYQLGRFFAWICCLLYLSSRLPQIYRNFERQSCEGLAMVMFGCALMGNVTYSASILFKSRETAYIYNSLPYLLGSAGTVCFDIIIFAQYLAYKKVQ